MRVLEPGELYQDPVAREHRDAVQSVSMQAAGVVMALNALTHSVTLRARYFGAMRICFYNCLHKLGPRVQLAASALERCFLEHGTDSWSNAYGASLELYNACAREHGDVLKRRARVLSRLPHPMRRSEDRWSIQEFHAN